MSISMPDYCERPSRLSTLRELAAPLDWLSYVPRAASLRKAPKGDGRQVVLFPGYMTGHLSMVPIKTFLERTGYKAAHWGEGINRGNVDEDVQAAGARVQALSATLGEPVTLIGWSLGGVVAREVARLFEPYVREVITMGTPVIGGPKYTVAAARYAKSQDLDLDAFEEEVHRRNSLGLSQPVTAIYSKSDGVISWQSAVDIYNSQARNIEVKSSHFGIGVNPEVWEIVAETLAAS